MNKKAAEMTIGTIIIIILALVVLVVLVYGFSSGWGSLWQKIIGYGGAKVNVQAVVDSCKVACTASQVYDYCVREREIYFRQDQKTPERKKCFELEGAAYGLDKCESITCPSQNTGEPQQPPGAPSSTPVA